jgi:hypothetical protein
MVLTIILEGFNIARRQPDDCATYTHVLCNCVESFPWTGVVSRAAMPRRWATHIAELQPTPHTLHFQAEISRQG